MKQIWKRLGPLTLALAMLFSLSACGGGLNELDATRYIQGVLDENYKGTSTKEFRQMLDITEDRIAEIYQSSLESEAEFFLAYFGIDSEDEDLFDQIVSMYKEIYNKSDYTVHPAAKLSSGSFGVEVTVRPIDLFQQASDLLSGDPCPAPFQAWLDQYADADVDAMTAEEYDRYDLDYAYAIVEVCQSLVPSIGYLDEESLVLQVKQDSDGAWTLPDDDFTNLDLYIIQYPGL